jgi:molybdate transport system substrate-binding protein
MSAGPALQGWAAENGSPGAARRATHDTRKPHRSNGRGVAALALVSLVAFLVASGCGAAKTAGGESGGGSSEIRVFAAASLTDAFTKLGEQFTAAHPSVKVTFNFAGSPDLIAQIQQGAPADVLATGDVNNMSKVATLVGQAKVFAGNRLAIAVEPGNPTGIRSLRDLSGGNLKVVLAAPQVPAGKYAQQALAKQGITVKPASLEDSVKGVVTKVSLGEADAGIVYATDISAAEGKVAGVPIPDDQNVAAAYPIAVVDETKQAANAQAFVDLVLSDAGQRVLRAYGFLPPPATK